MPSCISDSLSYYHYRTNVRKCKLFIDTKVYYSYSTLMVYELHSTHTWMREVDRNVEDGQSNMRFNNRDPVYLQVVRFFKEELATGRLGAGDVIPSRREIAGLLKINPNTAQKAYKEMEDQGLIITEGNSPSRITGEAELLSTIRHELIYEAVAAFVDSIRKIDAPVEEIINAVRQQYTAINHPGKGGSSE